MKRLLFLLALVLLAVSLTGCASNKSGYYAAVEAAHKHMTEVARMRADVEKARANSLYSLAQGGSETSRVAAAMALAFSGQGGGGDQWPQAMMPQEPQSEALQWFTAAAPLAGSLGQGWFSYRGAVKGAEFARDIALSTNEAFANMGSSIANTATGAYPFIGATYGGDATITGGDIWGSGSTWTRGNINTNQSPQ